jgi:pimeloyl-ACP methyl ester carboxylesterase
MFRKVLILGLVFHLILVFGNVEGTLDPLPPLLTDPKCFGLGLSGLTPEDINGITNLFRPDDPNIPRNTPELAAAAGYTVVNHTVTTTDGYNLRLFRIPHGKNEAQGSPGRPVVLMIHGLLASSDLWLMNYPEKNLPYRLADSGYDVWMVNSRGNKYSRSHATYNPDTPFSQFWDFSFHEMGKYDVPNCIDYVLAQTQQEKLFYIGHSQGGTQGIIGLSLDPSYNAKIRLAVFLAPAAFMNNSYSVVAPLALITGSTPGVVDDLLAATGTSGNGELLKGTFENQIFPYGCTTTLTTNIVCNSVIFAIMGYDYEQSQNELVSALVAHFPAGAAMKSLVHYVQLYKSGTFRQFDYGPNLLIPPIFPPGTPGWLINNIVGGNTYKYGTTTAPSYDLTAITAPVVIYAGPNDSLADEKDIIRLAPLISSNIDLAKTPNYRRVNHSCWNHVDFTGVARDVNPLLYDDVIATMGAY